MFFSEDIGRDTTRVYEDVLSFLGVVSDERTEFPVLNQNKVISSSRLLRLHRSVEFLSKIKQTIVPNINFGLDRLYLKQTPRQSLPEDLRQELLDYFAEDIAKLAVLTGRDLSHWLRPGA
ncbi:MAG: hypothetical protein ACSLE5_05510 [Porticoccaceae bacterium]